MATDVPEGVKDFNFCTLSVMGQLWANFPSPIVIAPARDRAQLREDARLDGRELNLSELPPVDLMVDTIEWLMTEGYIRGKLVPQMGKEYHQMILTEKGLRSMRMVPKAINEKVEPKPLGTLMREAAVGQLVGLAGKLVSFMLQVD